MLRRGLALGGGLIVLILVVLGVKGCLDARANRELSDYADNVTQIVEETEQTSKHFFGKLAEPGDLSVTDFTAEVNADRSADGQLRLAGRRPQRPRRHGPGPERAGADLRAAQQRDDGNRQRDADRARRRRRRQGDGGDRPPDAQAARRRRALRRHRPAGNQRRPRRQRDRGQRRAQERLPAGRNEVAGRKRGQRRARQRSAAPAPAAPPGCTASASAASASTAPNWAKKRSASPPKKDAEVEVDGRKPGRIDRERHRRQRSRPAAANCRAASNRSGPAKPAPPRSC